MLYKANQEYNKGNYKQAIKEFKESLMNEEVMAGSINYNIGVSYNKLEEKEKGFKYFLKALECNCSNDLLSKVYYNIGVYYYYKKEYKRAYLNFKTAFCYNTKDKETINILNHLTKKLNINETYTKLENVTTDLQIETIDLLKNPKEFRQKEHIEDYSISYLILYHKKNIGFEIVKYTINNQKFRNKILDESILTIDCKKRNTKKYNKILESIKTKYKIKEMFLIN